MRSWVLTFEISIFNFWRFVVLGLGGASPLRVSCYAAIRDVGLHFLASIPLLLQNLLRSFRHLLWKTLVNGSYELIAT